MGTLADTLSVRKVNEAAQAMARKRWKGTTKEERLAASQHAASARSAKAAARRAAREAQAQEPEPVSA
jgi:hypothetical protein